MRNKHRKKSFFGTILSFSLIIAFLFACEGPKVKIGGAHEFKLDNGMEIVLKENHASPMIASLIFVHSGSKYESKYNNGATHFLEHLLFNGTAIQTEDELSQGIERLGGYINAFTQKEITAYLVLMPKEYIEYGLAVQADMLFNSVFPKDKFPKERKIVIEEIKQGDDAEGAPAENFFEAKAMVGTRYAQPIIGYESIIANIPREAVIDYYKQFYGPNNMTALIIGDFDKDKITNSLKNIFGPFPAVELPAPKQEPYTPLTGQQVFKTSADVKSTYIKYSIEAPHYSKDEYFSFMLLVDYLSDNENSPLIKALKNGAEPLVTSVSAYLDTKKEFSRLNIDIITEKPDMVDSIITLTDNILQSLSTDPPSPELLSGYRVTRRCDEIYMSEKLHHYGFVKAPLMAITGWDFFDKIQENIDSVKIEDIAKASSEYLSSLNYIVTATYPTKSFAGEVETVSGPGPDEVIKFFENQKYPEYDLTSGKDFKLPIIKPGTEVEKRYSEYHREILPNGITVVVKSNPDSRVFALNVIGKNRSATELVGKDGITDFVNRMIEKGTANYSAGELAMKLSSIGAKVTLYDNPWIPFDDRYTTRQYSFMKFETIDEFTSEWIRLFTEMIERPAFDSVEMEQVRKEIFGLMGRNSGSTYKTARDAFYETLFRYSPYSKKINGNYRTVASITLSDLREHHRRIYAPENMIITVGTRQHPAGIMALLREKLQNIPTTGFIPIEPGTPKDISGVVTAHEKMDKEQIYIYLGNLLPSASSPDASALKVTSAVLSERLHKNIREKQGLAYQVGSSVSLDKQFGWYVCSMGTDVKNYKKAKEAILFEIERLKTEPPAEDELETAINSIWGSYLSANLSRINQLYYMGTYEYLGLGYDYGDKYISGIRSVTAEQVSEMAQKYFDTENYVIATAGNI